MNERNSSTTTILRMFERDKSVRTNVKSLECVIYINNTYNPMYFARFHKLFYLLFVNRYIICLLIYCTNQKNTTQFQKKFKTLSDSEANKVSDLRLCKF